MPVPFTDRKQRYWPKLAETNVHPSVELAFRQAFNGIYDCQDAFTILASEAQLHATISSGVITAVDVIKAGQYQSIPTVKAVGGGGSGASFTVSLNQNGGIVSVNVVNGGSSYTSAPYLVVQ